MDANVTFRLYPWRFHFVASGRVRFPPGNAANVLRGAFGHTLRNLACAPECPGTKTCPDRSRCAYARIFEPRAGTPGPSGLSDWPRPFVLRASHLDGRTFETGEPFHFDLHMFDWRNPSLEQFTAVFSELARKGFGPGRGGANFDSVEQFEGCGGRLGLLELPLVPAREPVHRITVRFITPTELKWEDTIIDRPEFVILFARVRDRISTLRALYDEGPLALDFRGMGERAARIRMTHCDVRHIAAERRSSRTGQVHSLGGIVGEAQYEGALTEFVPFLHAAWWTGVGRHTVWGKGAVQVVQ